MDPRFRTVALVAAALGLLVSLFFALRPQGDEATTTLTSAATTSRKTTTAAEPQPPTTTATPTPPATTRSQGPGTIHLDYAITSGNPVGGIARDSVARGRIVVIRVTSDVADHVHVHGYDITADVGPRRPTTLRLRAAVPGRFEIELEERGVQIAELEVRP